MKREEIKGQFKDIRKWYAEAVARTAEWKRTKTDTEAMDRIDELERLALRATEPDMVMVPIERLNEARHWAAWHLSTDVSANDFVDWVESITGGYEKPAQEDQQ